MLLEAVSDAWIATQVDCLENLRSFDCGQDLEDGFLRQVGCSQINVDQLAILLQEM